MCEIKRAGGSTSGWKCFLLTDMGLSHQKTKICSNALTPNATAQFSADQPLSTETVRADVHLPKFFFCLGQRSRQEQPKLHPKPNQTSHQIRRDCLEEFPTPMENARENHAQPHYSGVFVPFSERAKCCVRPCPSRNEAKARASSVAPVGGELNIGESKSFSWTVPQVPSGHGKKGHPFLVG